MKNTIFLGLAAVGLSIATSLQSSDAANFFSLDIGSDLEVSDPAGGAGEWADPGDIYLSSSVAGSLLSAAPALDDAGMFAAGDPAPAQNMPATAAPVGAAGLYNNYFDMDGYDATGARLSQFGLSPEAPLDVPIRRDNAPISCIYRARELAISFSDDSVAGWGAAAAPRVPTEGPSPFGAVYGTTAGQDEVMRLDVDATGGFPATVLSFAPVADELQVHVDLGPNPAGGFANDDDVDALDQHNLDDCAVHYFSADTEGRRNLNPGAIYEFTGAAAPAPVINAVHLGIPANTNLDAFELAWLPGPNDQGTVLALLYSVQPDNPATVIVESGGLVPSTIYASFMTGSTFVYVDGPAHGFDNVDAIAVSPPDTTDTDEDGVDDNLDNCILIANPDQTDADNDNIGNQCDKDLSNDCQVNFADLLILKSVFFTNDPVADFNVDGIVNIVDLADFRDAFLLPPGPAADPNLCTP